MKNKNQTHTRKISPKLGMLGLLGFLGFLGFLPRILNLTGDLNAQFAFLFFAFFGFFGFYYEGKMSDTLIDERFQLNHYRASYISNKVALSVIILVAILTVSVLKLNSEDMLSALIATIGLAFGLSVFLQPYLLYRFENEE